MLAYKGSGGRLHSFLTSPLDGGEWSSSRLCRFTPGKETRYPLHRRVYGPWNLSGRFEKEKNFFSLQRFVSRIVQSVNYSVHSLWITNLTHSFSCMFISILHVVRAATCPSSGELLYQCDTWFMSLCVDARLVSRSICSCIDKSVVGIILCLSVLRNYTKF